MIKAKFEDGKLPNIVQKADLNGGDEVEVGLESGKVRVSKIMRRLWRGRALALGARSETAHVPGIIEGTRAFGLWNPGNLGGGVKRGQNGGRAGSASANYEQSGSQLSAISDINSGFM